MESTVYLNTTARELRAALTGRALGRILATLQSQLTIHVKPYAEGDDAPALFDPGPDALRIVLKDDPTDTAFVFTTSYQENDDGDGYTFTIDSVDSAGLRTWLGDEKEKEATFEFEWTLDSIIDRASCPALIRNAYIRSDEEAPAPGEDESVQWFKDQIAAMITPGGYIEFQDSSEAWFHFGLNNGRAPS